jgi:peptidoglycan/LPS O-acetylase OafA/YrhL
VSARVSIVACQRRLLLLWVIMGAVALVLILIQTSPRGTYHDSASDIWEWFLPTVVPTLSLMLGTLVAEAKAPSAGATVDSFYFRMAAWLSAAYLALVILFLVMYAQSATPVADLKSTGKLVTSLYGVVGITLGVFFASRKEA